MAYIGGSEVSAIKSGSSDVSKVYVGSTLAWELSAFTGFQTSFEGGDTLFSGGSVGTTSTAQAYDGSTSWYINNTVNDAGDGSNLQTGLDTTKRYDCYSIWLYCDQALLSGGAHRVCPVGTAAAHSSNGWLIYLRNNNFAVGGNSSFFEFSGAPGSLAANTWHHLYFQVDWLTTSPNKSLANPQFSIWANGTQYVNAVASTNGAHTNGFATPTLGLDNWELTTSLPTTGSNRYFDKLIANVSDTAPVAAGNTTPAAIEAALLAF